MFFFEHAFNFMEVEELKSVFYTCECLREKLL